MLMNNHKPGPALFSSLLMLTSVAAVAQAQQESAGLDALPQQTALVGTWTAVPDAPRVDIPEHPARGLYHLRQHGNGVAEVLGYLAMSSPSWIVTSPDGKFAWVTNEEDSGRVTSLARDESGRITVINSVSSEGAQPTHAVLTPDAKFLLVANYSVEKGGAGVAVLPVSPQGALNAATQHIRYDAGSGAVRERQQSAHAHSVNVTPDGRYLYVADLGNDLLHAYRYHADRAQPLEAVTAFDVKMAPGSGPRHMVFTPDGKYAYVTAEMSGEVVIFTVSDGRLSETGKVRLTDDSDPAFNSAAGIILSPDNRFLITANRGEDNHLLVYRISQDGSLELAGRYASGGSEPRAFCFDPSGRYLLVTNVFSNNVVVFGYDAPSGALLATENHATIPTPTDVKFFN
ncbi:lactonase family protein [Erwinia sp. V71]|uniref:lactonase family protein n=1 Tax=Erwinia sp. V71 TaxID=3369424 RepID=UPI003F5FC7A9